MEVDSEFTDSPVASKTSRKGEVFILSLERGFSGTKIGSCSILHIGRRMNN